MAASGLSSASSPKSEVDKLLSFLGDSDYQTTTYRWDGLERRTRFVAEALATWLRPKEMVVLLTQEAQKTQHWGKLEHRLAGFAQHVRAVEIPTGDNEEELWAIFEKITQVVDDEETIAIDVTHAFRSLPMLLLAVAAFLQASKRVKIQHIFYGRYEHNPSKVSPVLDLVLLLHLLDWMEATRRFRELGDGSWIGKQLEATHNGLWRSKKADPKQLKTAGKQLRDFSIASQLARPIEAAELAYQLSKTLPEASQEVADHAKPFRLLLDEVQDQLKELAVEEPQRLNAEILQSQLSFIKKLAGHGLYLQAVQMAREWVVNWVIWQEAGRVSLSDEWLSNERRQRAECALNSSLQTEGAHSGQFPWLKDTALIDALRRVWSRLPDLRNDLAHCGMRKNPAQSKDIIENIRKCMSDLDALMKRHPSE